MSGANPTHIYYAVSKNNGYSAQEGTQAEARIRCLNCFAENIPGHSNYCPNCGIKFNKGGSNERDNQRT